jgi:ElaB/YqjD/DUF883 family membrane-anchored ribosome-binding protein
MRNTLYIAASALLLALGIASCEQEGPMEKSGENLDQAVEQAQDQAEKAVEETGDKLEQAGDRAEKTTNP